MEGQGMGKVTVRGVGEHVSETLLHFSAHIRLFAYFFQFFSSHILTSP
jgi:hypothetical protein